MLKTFPLDFIRQILEQTLLIEHIKNDKLFGGKNQINIASFYEQLKTQDEIDRFVEVYRDLDEQQNRMGLIGNGVLVSPENPTITNLYSTLIVPLSYTCSIRTTLENRDDMIITINNLINELKGSKVDIAQLNCIDKNGKPCTKPFMVGTIGYNEGAPRLNNGDYIGSVSSTTNLEDKLEELGTKGIIVGEMFEEGRWFYVSYNDLLTVAYCDGESYNFIVDDGQHPEIIFPPEHTSFEKYKVSLSFDSIRCDEPRGLNAEEFCEISFGGSATLVSEKVKLGNDLLKIAIKKNKIVAENDIVFEDTYQYLEPLELPSGSNANTKINQLLSNNFISNSHTDALAISLQYTFILDETYKILREWFDYARYGTQGLTVNDISPNIIYNVDEMWCSWGNFVKKSVLAKIVENIDIENTESDTLTISITMQVQGANN